MCRKNLRRRLSLNCRAGIHQNQLHNSGRAGASPGSGPVVLESKMHALWCFLTVCRLHVRQRVTSIIKDDLVQPITAHIPLIPALQNKTLEYIYRQTPDY